MRRPPNLLKSMTEPEPIQAPADPDPPPNYLDFYGLSKPPFGGTPDTAGYILLPSHRRAFERLVDHILNGAGVMLLLAEEDTGKTETLRSAAAVATQSGQQTTFIPRPANGRISLQQLISVLQGQPAAEPLAVDEAVKRFTQPPRKVLIADDVELMPNECVRLLLSLARVAGDQPGDSAIVLSSSAAPTDDIKRSELTQLIGLARDTIRMSRLTPAEVHEYIERSLWKAGGTTRRLITADAMKSLIARSGGLPGTVNRLMEAAFTAGFARGDTLITARTVAAAAGPVAPRPAPRTVAETNKRTTAALQMIAAGLLVTGASVFIYKALNVPSRRPAATVSQSTVQPPHPMPPAVTQKTEAPPVVNPVETLSPDLIAVLMKRGTEALDLGDLAAARLLFQRAAEAGSAAAATALGKTYDPNFAVSGNARDLARAMEWYQKAVALGDPKAANLITRLRPH